MTVPPTTQTNAPGTVSEAQPASAGGSVPPWWPWAAGVLLGLVVLGPGLSGGSLLSLDLLVTPDIPVPNGMYGLGPALSQRVPLFAVLGVGSAVVGGPVITKVLIVGFLAAGFAGAARLARVLAPAGVTVGIAGQAAAGLLWAVGPYALTRVAVGHINLLWVVAILPWVLPRLCRPAEHLPSTFLAALALAIGGPGGGTLGVAIAFLALLVQPAPRRFLRPTVVVLAPQAIWALPTAVLLWAGAGVTGSNGFATQVSGIEGWPALLAGNGFWRADYQVGAVGWPGAICGLIVVGLASVGGQRILRDHHLRSWQGAATFVAGVGLALAVASAVPGIRDAYGWLSELPFGAPLRESHRFLALWLVWAAPAAALGAAVLADRLHHRAVLALPLVVALALSVPGWWGLDGRLEPVDYPAGWGEVRAAIEAQPGTAVALPWSEYPLLSFAGDRQVFNPLPEFLGGDVISSYDPRFDTTTTHQEQVDRRSVVVDQLVQDARDGKPISVGLGDLGVRWVVLAHEYGWEEYGPALAADAGLERVISRPDIELYQVRSWVGDAVGPDGEGFDVRRPVPMILRTDAPAGSVLDVAGAPGWVQGWGKEVQVTADGRLRLTADGGTIWFWPAPLIIFVDLTVAGLGIWCLRSRRSKFGRILAPRATRG